MNCDCGADVAVGEADTVGMAGVVCGKQAEISITKTRQVIIIRFIELPRMHENK